MPKFTDSFVKGLKPKDNRYFIRDPGSEGFGIRVMPSGTKVFYLVYKTGGSNKQQWLRLGAYPEMSLTKARQEHRKMKSIQDSGKDPATAVRNEKHERRNAWTVDHLCDEFLEKYSRVKKRPRSALEDERNLARDVRRLWGKRKAREIRRGDVIVLLDEILNRGSGVQANRTQATISKMFAWALEREVVEFNPATGVSKQTVEVPKDRNLADSEITILWKALNEEKSLPKPISQTLKLILLTGLRPGEIVNARRNQLEGDWLTLPGSATKNYSAHGTYLSPFAMQIIGDPREDYLISREGIKRFEVYTLSAWVRRFNYFGLPPWSPHDLRRTCTTKLAELGTLPHVVSKILNHKPSGITARVYDKHLYSDDIQQALLAWSLKLAGLTRNA